MDAKQPISAKDPKEQLVEKFTALDFPRMTIVGDKVSCVDGEMLSFSNGYAKVKFYSYTYKTSTYNLKRNGLTLTVDENIDPNQFIRFTANSYDISWFDYINAIFSISGTYTNIKIVKNGTKVIRRAKQKEIIIPEKKYLELMEDSSEVYKKGKSTKNKVETYLTNNLIRKHTTRKIKETTTTNEGDFTFIIKRFNLKNKKKKKDYSKYLNDEDIKNLEMFNEKLIKDEVFSKDFLRRLDDYFIKEKLTDIISLGREILGLGVTNMKSKKAKLIISKVVLDQNEKIGQMETLWQRFFERNLLYLIFSYKKIFPKVEMKNVQSDKKYPDFIGINHYNGLDVIEIKTHLKNVMTWDKSHNNFSFSSELSKSIIQTMNYMDAIVQKRFKDSGDESKITNSTDEENLYHPRGIIIISSMKALTSTRLNKSKKEALKRDFTKLRNSVNNIEILTFDEILDIADDYVKNINSNT